VIEPEVGKPAIVRSYGLSDGDGRTLVRITKVTKHRFDTSDGASWKRSTGKRFGGDRWSMVSCHPCTDDEAREFENALAVKEMTYSVTRALGSALKSGKLTIEKLEAIKRILEDASGT